MLKEYQAHIDVPQDGDWEEIEVDSITVEAFNCNDAFMRATLKAQESYDDFYVWEITEDDVIEKE